MNPSNEPPDSTVRFYSSRAPQRYRGLPTVTAQPFCRATRLGLNRLALRLIWLQVAVLTASAALYSRLGLSISWPTTVPTLLLLGIFAVAWSVHYWMPGAAKEWIVAETLFVTLLVCSFAFLTAPAQYAAVALKRPLIDPWLAAADGALGIDVPSLAAWTHTHNLLAWVLWAAYVTFIPQLFIAIVMIGLVRRDREALWEFCFHFHFCLAMTLVALALFPAECAFNYYGFASTLDQTRFTSHFFALRLGTHPVIRFDDLEGLISMPSFHASGGLMVTWSLRQFMWLRWAIAFLNVLMITATFMTGAHYFVDVVATVLLFLASIGVYRRWGRGLIEQPVQ
jgi:hypothetical protein